MYKREHHIRIATVLQALDASLLVRHHCLFGGGTAIVLSRGEYRKSLDIDFLVSDQKGYRALRQLMTGKQGIQSIVRDGMSLIPSREIRADQYGLRTMLQVVDVEIKFEIVYEGRIELEQPDINKSIYGVATLTDLDLAASKLLANSDRWYDDAVFNRDLIDLAMLQLDRGQLRQALEKASEAYGESVKRDLFKAIEALATREGRLEECMDALQIEETPKALLWKNIRDLKKL